MELKRNRPVVMTRAITYWIGCKVRTPLIDPMMIAMMVISDCGAYLA